MRVKYLGKKFSKALVVLIISGLVLPWQMLDRQSVSAQSTADPFKDCKTLGANASRVKNAIKFDLNNSLGSFNFTSKLASGTRSGINDQIILNASGYSSSLKSGYTDKFGPFHPNATKTTINFKIARCSQLTSRYIDMTEKGDIKDYADIRGNPSRSYIYEIYLLVANSKDKTKQYAIGPQILEYQPSAENSSINAISLLHIKDSGECTGNPTGTYSNTNQIHPSNQGNCRKLQFNVGLSGYDLIGDGALICRITIYQLKPGVDTTGGIAKNSSNWESSAQFTQYTPSNGGGAMGLDFYQNRGDKCLYKASALSISQALDFNLHKDSTSDPENTNYFFAGVEYQKQGEGQTTHFGRSSNIRGFTAKFDAKGNVTSGSAPLNEPDNTGITPTDPSGNSNTGSGDDDCPLKQNNQGGVKGWLYGEFVGSPVCGALSILINGATGIADYVINSLFVPSLGIQYGS